MSSLRRFAWIASVFALSAVLPATAGAALRKDGTWPPDKTDKTVSLAFDGKPSDGLSKLASEAGWSLVVSKAVAVDEHEVHIDVQNQPADAVLEALFIEGNVVATRNGSLITITPATATPSAAQAPAPVPSVRGEDRNVVGDSVVIEKDEVVRTLTVTGGSVRILGTVTGALVVFGGNARVEDGGHVVGDATAIGGTLTIAKGGRVDGKAGVVGGMLTREDGAIVDGTKKKAATVVKSDDEDDDDEAPSTVATKAAAVGSSITKMALLFVMGCVLLALATRKMESLTGEIAARPMRNFALGIVGSIAATIGLCVLCVTIVGIPVAILGLLLGVFAVYAAITAVLTTAGAAIIGHKTKNSYLHLLAGTVGFLVIGAIPWIGGLATLAVTMIAMGALVSTRGAGAFASRRKLPGTF
ncbi:hypothetical protein AKJ09_09921 [Labilithrix luteola]|uniref:DUF8173 domain-containing protein n=1 Tax=Labilithrix luteola TaxID=1391654 RepID=A0A0K1QC12_9BACT|nr:polymer-forming cytoskeletal protein [Labilithrix luteola]AKV03258.1 hypothetical protein AKJ09_09921 [Labilithrix luteola]